MSRICLLCHLVMPPAQEQAGHVVTHCVCPSCRQDLSHKRTALSLGEYLNQFDAPVLVLDDDVRVLGFNEPARHLLGNTLPQMRGRCGGDVIECAYARLPGGCGNTEHCKACTIRNTVTATHATGASQKKIPAYQDILTPAGVREVRFLISTEKIGDFVLLRIDNVSPGW